MEARNLVMDEIVKEKVPPLLAVTLRVAGVTCRLEFAAALMVPGPVTVAPSRVPVHSAALVAYFAT